MTSALQCPSANEHTAANNLAVRFALVLLFATSSVSVAVAQTKTCECKFDTKEYDAYGTKGACGIYMYNNAHTCEISFSGAGANANLLKDLLGENALKNQFAVAPEVFEQYVAYERNGTKGRFLEPSFIETSLIVLARGALFRESVNKQLSLKDIDRMLVDFSKTNSVKIAQTFAGKAAPFDVKGEQGVFSVGQGYVELKLKLGTVRVVYFSEEPR